MSGTGSSQAGDGGTAPRATTRASVADRADGAERSRHDTLHPALEGALGRCPRCGQGRLFDGLLEPVDRCAACGNDWSAADPADGPVVFVVLIVGFLVVGLALYAEVAWRWSLTRHFLTWPPLALLLCLPLMRLLKGALIGQHHAVRSSRPEERP